MMSAPKLTRLAERSLNPIIGKELRRLSAETEGERTCGSLTYGMFREC